MDGGTQFPLGFVPYSHTRAVFGVGIFFLVTSWTTALSRFATRTFIVRSVGLDDWALLIGLILFTAFTISILVITVIIPNRYTLSLRDITLVTNLLYAVEILYIATIILLKISAGLLFLRFMIITWQRRFVWSLIALSTLIGLAYCVFMIFQCGNPGVGPPFFEKRLGGMCVSSTAIITVSYTHGIITAMTDVFFALSPILALHNAQISTREKIVVCSILSLGVTSGIASAVRVRFTKVLADDSIYLFYNIFWLAILSIAECGLGIIACSLAALRPLIRKSWAQILSLKERSNLSRSNATVTSHKSLEGPSKLKHNETFSADDNVWSPQSRYDPDIRVDTDIRVESKMREERDMRRAAHGPGIYSLRHGQPEQSLRNTTMWLRSVEDNIGTFGLDARKT